MREIRFRVWDRENKKMHNDMSLWNIATNDKLKDAFYDACREQKKFVAMQSTELFDRNGKEIYERRYCFKSRI